MVKLFIRKRREAAGLTVTQLADRLSVTPGCVSQWEIGFSVPSAAKLPAIASALGCKIDDLYREEATE